MLCCARKAVTSAASGESGELPENYSLEFNWETRSGASIGKLQEKGDEAAVNEEAIVKAGDPEKLRREAHNIQRWEQLMPGLPPRVIQLSETGDRATLLLEFLEGYTFQELILNAEPKLIDRALGQIQDVLEQAWVRSRRNEPVHPQFVEQVAARTILVNTPG